MCAHRLTTADTDAGAQADTNNLPQPHGLQPADVLVARAVLHTLAPTWTLDEHQDVEDGSLMLMLTPPGAEDTSPTFVLTHTPNGIEVAAVLGDSCDTLHTAATIRCAVWMALTLHNHTAGVIERDPQNAHEGA